MTAATAPVCRIIAGPNGAGKTTFALKYLPLAQCRHFVNADLIAAGLSPLAPELQSVAASRLFLRQIEQHIHAGRDFAFETTLSGRTYLRLIQRLRSQGWRVELVYLALSTVELSKLRVEERVKHGGHSIPAADIVRRFPRSLHNLLYHYCNEVNVTRCFLNNATEPELVFIQRDLERIIVNQTIHDLLLQEAEQWT